MKVENNLVGAGRGNFATLDEDLIYELASIGCTYNEIATICQVNVTTLERRVKDVITLGHANQNMSIRRVQLAVALSGNPSMLIWLGKQELGQRDNKSVELTGADGGPIKQAFEVEFVNSTPVALVDAVDAEVSEVLNSKEDDNDQDS